MKTVISASRRTDIPAFYLNWFMEALRKGYVEVRNPFYRKNVKQVDLTTDAVEWIVFWSRNYNYFLKHCRFFSDYRLFFHFTILPKTELEKSAPPLAAALGQMEQLSRLYGSDHIVWRYDPLVFWKDQDRLHSNHEPGRFESLCKTISQFGVKRCYTSFVHPYARYLKRFRHKFPQRQLYHTPGGEQLKIINEMAGIASKYDIQIFSCCNDNLLETHLVQKGRCIDGKLLNQLAGQSLVSTAKTATRDDCGCTRSVDIGDYHNQPCSFGCIYCYANPQWR